MPDPADTDRDDPEAPDQLPPWRLEGALLVPFLNGIEHVGILRERYHDAEVVPATIRVEALRSDAGEIEHASPFAAVELAPGPGNRERVASLAARLAEAGLDVSIRDDETAMLWDKLSFLSPLALVTTHAGAPAGAVRTERREDALAVIHEVRRSRMPRAPAWTRRRSSSCSTACRSKWSRRCSATRRPGALSSSTRSAAPCCGRPMRPASRRL